MPDLEALRENTFSAFGDLDASPTKAWVIMHRDADPQSFQYAVGRLPKYELYDMQADPHCLKNLAEAAASRGVRENLHQRLMKELQQTGDPRVSDNIVFEQPPFTDEFARQRGKGN